MSALGAINAAFTWLTTHSQHPPYCDRWRIVPDGAHRSGLTKDYGGRYATDDEAPCTCGLDALHNTLCQVATALAATEPAPRDEVREAAFNPLVHLPGEYEMGRMIREAVDYDPDKGRMYLLCSVGELAQRITRALATLGEP
jgi:hypothetical protein